ncbi:hypothetical protein EV174_000186, partial [Coemansia sp. RSA 2320]
MLPRLRELSVAGCTQIGDVAVGRIARAFSSSLQILDVSCTETTIRSLCALASMASIVANGAETRTLALHTLYMREIAFQTTEQTARAEVDHAIEFNAVWWSVERFALFVPHLTRLTIAGENSV